jgi:hypothetical protein
MAGASYARSSFLGGEWSQFVQGRNDRPDYVTALNVCLNALPLETGAWVRRPGFRFAGTTRAGLPGRLMKFDLQQVPSYAAEFTDGHLRFFSGVTLVADQNAPVLGISTANPAVVQLGVDVSWVTGNHAYITSLGAAGPILQNRVFKLTKIGTANFSLADAVTGQNIDGAVSGLVGSVGAIIWRVTDFATPYVGGSWASLRMAQTDETAFLLSSAVPPYALSVAVQPAVGQFALFALAAAVFNDGPYLDPFTNGVRASPSAVKGVINVTLAFAAYDAAAAYAIGAFVTYSGVNYKSLVDQNVGHQPDISPTQWVAVSAALAISPSGFRGTDVGRLVRFYSEPDLWDVATAYVLGNVVTYNPSGRPDATTYWRAKAGSTGKIPGNDTTNWEIAVNAALWTWGKIVSLANLIDRALAGSVNIGTATGGGGLAAAFDGVTTQAGAACASTSYTVGLGALVGTVSDYVGKNYTAAGAQAVSSATVYPSSNFGFVLFGQTYNSADGSGPKSITGGGTITVNLRGKTSAPASASDGTLLGTSGLVNSSVTSIFVTSADQVTTWNYVWLEFIYQASGDVPAGLSTSETVQLFVAEVQFFGPAGTSASTAISVEILGPPLLYTTPIRTWRLGLYSNTTGWPTRGTYSDGRLWLSGAVPNRVDACVANGITGGAVNFAPTDQAGNVLASSAISYTFNAPPVSPILWMTPDLQGVICGTKAGEWMVQAPTAGPISPTNVAARRMTRIGCADVEPVHTEHTTVFLQRFGRKIMELFADVFSGKFTAPHITFTGKHLTTGGVQEMTYQQELAPIVWARVSGNLIGCTYKRDTLMTSQHPDAAGWHRHTLGSGRAIESVAVSSSIAGTSDALAVVTNDPANGIRHVEVMTDILDEDAELADASYLDDAVVPTSTTPATITAGRPYGGLVLNGLWHLNGKTVQVWAGGLDCGVQENGTFTDFVVANGSVTVPYGDGISAGSAKGLFTADFVASFGGGHMPIVVGHTYTSDGQLVPPQSAQESGARAGPALGKMMRHHQFAAQLVGSQGVSFGTRFDNLIAAEFRQPDGTPYLINQQFTGIYRSTVEDSNTLSDSKLCWRVTRPYICNVVNVGGFLQTQDA